MMGLRIRDQTRKQRARQTLLTPRGRDVQLIDQQKPPAGLNRKPQRTDNIASDGFPNHSDMDNSILRVTQHQLQGIDGALRIERIAIAGVQRLNQRQQRIKII